jgi:hypothetical protein
MFSSWRAVEPFEMRSRTRNVKFSSSCKAIGFELPRTCATCVGWMLDAIVTEADNEIHSPESGGLAEIFWRKAFSEEKGLSEKWPPSAGT